MERVCSSHLEFFSPLEDSSLKMVASGATEFICFQVDCCDAYPCCQPYDFTHKFFTDIIESANPWAYSLV
jgi:hypothetical protein